MEVQLQSRIFCPNCKVTVHLVDDSASAHGALEDVESAFRGLQRELDRFGKG